MKIKDGYVLKKVMGRYMIVSLREDGMNHMQTLNETGAFLWDLLNRDSTVEEMTEKLTAEYETDSETARADIETFIGALRASSLLEE